MRLPDNISEYAEWCSFCNAEPADGELAGAFPFNGQDHPMIEAVLPIGKNCREMAALHEVIDKYPVE